VLVEMVTQQLNWKVEVLVPLMSTTRSTKDLVQQ
jgi:hypothetical protein